jgi:hypothetical protein
LLDDLCDAFGIDPHRFGCAEMNDEMVVLRHPDLSRIGKRILRAVVEPDRKRSKRSAFHPALDLFNFHRATLPSWMGHRQRPASVKNLGAEDDDVGGFLPLESPTQEADSSSGPPPSRGRLA